MNRNIKFVQLNVNKSKIASLQLRDLCKKNCIDVALLQDPLVQGNRVYGFEDQKCVLGHAQAGAAIIIIDEEIRTISLSRHTSQYVATARLSKGDDTNAITVVSAYFKYNMPTPSFIEKLRHVLELEPRTIIGADVNGHSGLWHCPDTNERGRCTEGLIEDFDLILANRPNSIHTYEREGMGASNIDITMMTAQLAGRVQNWNVHDTTDSDHNTITYSISMMSTRCLCSPRKYFNDRKADWDKYVKSLLTYKKDITATTINEHANSIVEVIRKAAIKSIPHKSNNRRRLGKQPWWTHRLMDLKRALDRNRRIGLHIRDKPAYNTLKNEYLTEIRKAKMAAWRNFAEDINVKTWGKAFSWAKKGSRPQQIPVTMRREDGTETSTLDETAKLLLGTFFPRENEPRKSCREGPLDEYLLELETGRVKTAIWRMRPHKAPGQDGITAAMLRKAWPVLSDEITNLFRSCITEGLFPETWRRASLIVIPKPGKKVRDTPKAYRAVCLLPTLGKALETLIIQDLEPNLTFARPGV